MTNFTNNPLSFVSGCILDQDQILVTAQIDELVEAGETDSFVLKWKRSDCKWREVCDLEWSATCLCSGQTDQIFSTGPLGRVVIHDGNGSREEDIDNSSQGTSLHGDIRDLQLIGEHLYTTGMGRQVYRREGDDNWVRRDIGVLQTPSTTEVTGFNSIDGLNENDIYAVGFYGEIWREAGIYAQILLPSFAVAFIVSPLSVIMEIFEKQKSFYDSNLQNDVLPKIPSNRDVH